MVQAEHLVGKVSHQQVRPAAAVVIGPVCAHSPARHTILAVGHPRGHAFFGEPALPVIAVQFVGLGVIGDEDIGPTVAVVIENCDPERLTGGVADAGFFGNVFKPAAAQIMK